MNVLDLLSAIGSLGTAAGVLLVGMQLMLTRRQMVADFERAFVERYVSIIDRIPLGVLLGDEHYSPSSEQVERALYDYFELCEEEMYYRRAGRVSDATWQEWWAGISLHFRRPLFRTIFDQLVSRPGPGVVSAHARSEQFEQVRRAFAAIDHDEAFDPKA